MLVKDYDRNLGGYAVVGYYGSRDTIIVLPTKKLAYQKYLRGYNKDRTSNRFLYVGSDIPEENCKSPTDEQIRSYIAEKRTGTFSPRKYI